MENSDFHNTDMDWTNMRSERAGILAKLDDKHPLKRELESDRKGEIEIWEYLAKEVPSKIRDEISPDNQWENPGRFISIISEFRCHVLLEKLGQNPVFEDNGRESGVADFSCGNFWVEVTAKGQWDKFDVLKKVLEERVDLETGYLEIILGDEIRSMPWDSDDIDPIDELLEKLSARNELSLAELQKIDGLTPNYLEGECPLSVVPRKEFAERMVPDQRVSFAKEDRVGIKDHFLEKYSGKNTNGRPLVVFYQSEMLGLDGEDFEDILHGVNSSSTISGPSKIVEKRTGWTDYLRMKGYTPESEEPGCIKEGGEGAFVNEELDSVAGVIFLSKNRRLSYIPNIYTDCVPAKRIYDELATKLDGIHVSEVTGEPR